MFLYWLSAWVIYSLLKVECWSPFLLFLLFPISPFRSVNICFIYLDIPLFGTYIFFKYYILWINWHVNHYIMTFFLSYYSFDLKSIWSDISIATPILFLFPFVPNIFQLEEIPFNICYKAALVVMKSFSFCLSGKIYLPSRSEEHFNG